MMRFTTKSLHLASCALIASVLTAPTEASGNSTASAELSRGLSIAAAAPLDTSSAPVDSDGDGVPDSADTCANTPSGTEVDDRGCEIDTDRDGVVDSRDTCTDTPAGSAINANGCPVPLAGKEREQ